MESRFKLHRREGPMRVCVEVRVFVIDVEFFLSPLFRASNFEVILKLDSSFRHNFFTFPFDDPISIWRSRIIAVFFRFLDLFELLVRCDARVSPGKSFSEVVFGFHAAITTP